MIIVLRMSRVSGSRPTSALSVYSFPELKQYNRNRSNYFKIDKSHAFMKSIILNLEIAIIHDESKKINSIRSFICMAVCSSIKL